MMPLILIEAYSKRLLDNILRWALRFCVLYRCSVFRFVHQLNFIDLCFIYFSFSLITLIIVKKQQVADFAFAWHGFVLFAIGLWMRCPNRVRLPKLVRPSFCPPPSIQVWSDWPVWRWKNRASSLTRPATRSRPRPRIRRRCACRTVWTSGSWRCRPNWGWSCSPHLSPPNARFVQQFCCV